MKGATEPSERAVICRMVFEIYKCSHVNLVVEKSSRCPHAGLLD